MKVVNAIWELRNLGKRTIEISLEKVDYLREPEEVYAEIEAAEHEYQSEYTVVKVKTGKSQIGKVLQGKGFWHIETQIHLKALREDIENALKKYKGLFGDISFQSVKSEMEVCHIQDEIRKGIFVTDRIALDPYFSVSIANRRYANWVGDEVKQGSVLSYRLVGDRKVGFGLMRNGVGLLGGAFIDCQEGDCGGAIEFAGLQEALYASTENIFTSVSSNNLKILRLHEAFGYRVKALEDVFVIHDPLK